MRDAIGAGGSVPAEAARELARPTSVYVIRVQVPDWVSLYTMSRDGMTATLRREGQRTIRSSSSTKRAVDGTGAVVRLPAGNAALNDAYDDCGNLREWIPVIFAGAPSNMGERRLEIRREPTADVPLDLPKCRLSSEFIFAFPGADAIAVNDGQVEFAMELGTCSPAKTAPTWCVRLTKLFHLRQMMVNGVLLL